MKLNQKHLALFREEALYWINKFGLVDWEVIIQMNDDNPDLRASCGCSSPTERICFLTITQSWDNEPDTEEIALAAFHEVLELLLMQLREGVHVVGVDEELVDREIHRIIRIFENTIWRADWAARMNNERAQVKRSGRGK